MSYAFRYTKRLLTPRENKHAFMPQEYDYVCFRQPDVLPSDTLKILMVWPGPPGAGLLRFQGWEVPPHQKNVAWYQKENQCKQ